MCATRSPRRRAPSDDQQCRCEKHCDEAIPERPNEPRMLAGQAVMINWSDVAPEHRPAYYEWHSREHMVGRVAIPGFRRGRRYIKAAARRDFLVLYEVADLSVLTGTDYLARANAPSPLTQRTTPFVRNSVRGLSNVRAS